MSVEGKLYELGYLLSPLLAEDQVAEVVEQSLKSLILKIGGELKREDTPRLITLAYPIKQVIEHKGTTFREAYFGSLYFTAPAETIPELSAGLKSVGSLIRHLLIISRPNMPRPAARRPVKPRQTPVVVPVAAIAVPLLAGEEKLSMTTAAIDQEIENLIHVS